MFCIMAAGIKEIKKTIASLKKQIRQHKKALKNQVSAPLNDLSLTTPSEKEVSQQVTVRELAPAISNDI